MKSNKTRYAILGILLDSPSSGYDIKSLMGRSTVYFWRESDSTIYPMLKVLAEEGKVLSQVVYVGKKKKEIFSITEKGRLEFKAWFKSPTSDETPRNEFLLKFFFTTDHEDMVLLFQERLEKVKKVHEEYKKIEERLESMVDSSLKKIRLKALRYGLSLLESEIKWLIDEKGV
ncbi:MAG TPA: PadR family transcriptional regulator [Parachlamydiaceae bacterium]|nr:PadR family transcriptional regulator [Parachlamydiaceae bacterium]HEV8052225.1 PadR family transcriptional regulator [Parachlamydiaceae bacterium]